MVYQLQTCAVNVFLRTWLTLRLGIADGTQDRGTVPNIDGTDPKVVSEPYHFNAFSYERICTLRYGAITPQVFGNLTSKRVPKAWTHGSQTCP